MYRIGEFSRITRLTVKALRYYDREGLLVPSVREENGYRLYSQEDFQRAQQIALLRQLGFSIQELRDALPRCGDQADLRAFLVEKRELLLGEIQERRDLMRAIDLRLDQLRKAEYTMNDYQIQIKQFPAMRVASLRTRASYSQTGAQIQALLQAVKETAGGAPFNLYYDGAHADPADMETCVPLKAGAAPAGVAVRTLPAFQALCTLHVGPYETLNLAYKALLDYGARQGLAFQIPAREFYRKVPGMVLQGEPAGYETEIALPLSEGVSQG